MLGDCSADICLPAALYCFSQPLSYPDSSEELNTTLTDTSQKAQPGLHCTSDAHLLPGALLDDGISMKRSITSALLLELQASNNTPNEMAGQRLF